MPTDEPSAAGFTNTGSRAAAARLDGLAVLLPLAVADDLVRHDGEAGGREERLLHALSIPTADEHAAPT